MRAAYAHRRVADPSLPHAPPADRLSWRIVDDSSSAWRIPLDAAAAGALAEPSEQSAKLPSDAPQSRLDVSRAMSAMELARIDRVRWHVASTTQGRRACRLRRYSARHTWEPRAWLEPAPPTSLCARLARRCETAQRHHNSVGAC